jgi:hypothetical protein
MKLIKLYVVACVLLCSYISCDDGDIYPKETEFGGITVETEISVKGINAWPEEYEAILAAYGEDTENPIKKKTLEKPNRETESIKVTFSHVPSETKTMAIILLNNRKTVYKFTEVNIDTSKDTVRTGMLTFNLLHYERLQNQLFNQCITCHGGSESAASNLYLTPGKSYEMLFNYPSTIHPDKKRVLPGNVSESFIVNVLKEAASVEYDHTKLSSLKKDDITLLEEWIEAGAKKQ